MTQHGFCRADGQHLAMFLENSLDGLCFIPVIQGCGRTVGVDVIHLGRCYPGVNKGRLHAAGGAFMPRGRRYHVICIARQSVTDNFRIDTGAPFPRSRHFFQYQKAASFPDDETIPPAVKRPAGFFRLIIPGGEGPHGIETRHGHRSDGGIDAAGNHGLGVTPRNHPDGIANGGGSGSTGRGAAIDRSLRSQSDGDMAGAQVGQNGGNDKGRYLPGARPDERCLFFFQCGQAADCRTDVDSQALGIHLSACQRRIRGRHLGRRQGVDDKIIEATQFLFIDKSQGVEVFYLTGNFGGKGAAVEFGDRADAGSACTDGLPGLRHRVAQWRNRAETCYYNPSSQLLSIPPAIAYPVHRGYAAPPFLRKSTTF